MNSSDETCDDGNNEDGDGCSRRCEVEQVQSKSQQNCIAAVNKASAFIAMSQLKEGSRCLKMASRDNWPYLGMAECLAADDRGKVAKATAKLTEVQDDPKKSKCPETPDWGYADDGQIIPVAKTEALQFFASLVGEDADSAVLDAADPLYKTKAACQGVLVLSAEKILQTQLKNFEICAKKALKNRKTPAQTTLDLETCIEDATGDPAGKAGVARQKFVDKFDSKCAAKTVEIADVLPSTAALAGASATDVSNAVVTAGRCATCKIFNAAGSLRMNCDDVDDGDDQNASCL